MDTTQLVSSVVWLAAVVLSGIVLYRLKTRRSHIGPAAAGTVYDMIHEDKRKAIEIVVADKAAARDFEHADDDDEPPRKWTVGSGERKVSVDSGQGSGKFDS